MLLSAQGIRKVRPAAAEKTGDRVAFLLRDPRIRVAILGGVLVLSTLDTITTFFPIYGEGIGLSATVIGLILGVRAGASMLVRPLQPLFVERLTRRGALVVILASSALSTSLLGLISHVPALFLLAVAVGMSLGLGQPISMTEVVDVSPAEYHGRILGLRLAGNRAAQIVGPALYGALASVGMSLVFVGSGILLALGAAVTLHTPRTLKTEA